ncbi:MAG TPA: recombination-associated protein RdgC, partial [Accumulibacter sp.]|nr:recombination-associated protein RdgC [Accumulibacter sp.]
MWFKNLQVYRLPKNWHVDLEQLEEQLARMVLLECSATAPRSLGWLPPRDGGPLLHLVNQQ